MGHNLNAIEKWAARDEEGQYRDIIVISDKEPTMLMGKWQWRNCTQYWTIGPNEGNVCINPGQKKKLKIYIIESDE